MDQVGDDIQARRAAGQELTPDQQQAQRFFAYYWIAVLGLLFALVVVAAVEMSAIRRYAARHFRQIRDDRRAMLEEELAKLRRGRRPGDPSVN
jgi:hypothetical protein